MWPQTRILHISPENQVRKCGKILEILFGPAHVFLLPCTTFRGICLRCAYNPVYLHLSKRNITCICKQDTKKVSKVSSWKKKKKGSWQVFTMPSSKYNYSLKQSCLEMHTTPIMHSGNLSDFLHLQMCLSLTECLSQTGYSGWAVCQAWWCRAECTIPSDSRHGRTAGWNRERFQSVTMELTGYTPPKVLVIRSEVTRTICQVIFHMMMWVQDAKNRVWLRMDFAYTYTCTPVGQWDSSFIFVKSILWLIHHRSWKAPTINDTHKRRKLNARYVPLPFGKTP